MQNLFSKNLQVKFFEEGGYTLNEESIGNAFGLFSFHLSKKYQELLNMTLIMIGDVFIEYETNTLYMIGLTQDFTETALSQSSFKGISVFPIKINDRKTFLSKEDVVSNYQEYLPSLLGKKLKFLGNIYMDDSKENMFNLLKHKYSIDLFNNLKSNILYLKFLVNQNMGSIKFHDLDEHDVLTLRYDLKELTSEYALFLKEQFKEKRYCVSFYLDDKTILSEALLICDKSLDLFLGLNEDGQIICYGSNGKQYLTLTYMNHKVESIIDSITVDKDEQQKYKEKLLQFVSN